MNSKQEEKLAHEMHDAIESIVQRINDAIGDCDIIEQLDFPTDTDAEYTRSDLIVKAFLLKMITNRVLLPG